MLKRILYIYVFVLLSKLSTAQCPQIYNYLGNLVTKPYFISCTGTNSYNVNFASNTSWGAYTINWGDGTSNTAGGAYTANSLITHVYNSATPDTFVITLNIPSLGCTLKGIAVMEKPVNASIQIPIGGVTTVCAPKALLFTNSSTDVSETTKFTWNFGDGSPSQTFDYTNAGQTILHTYNKNTVNCQTQVTLSAKNYCTPLATIANFNPIQIYDIDIAAITPSAFIKCWPDNVFTFTNTTNRNCVPQGNTFQRQEKWNLGNYWGLGHDSIINWRPWPPTNPITIAFPAVGNYTVQLKDSNLCGVDTKVQTVSIVNPPTAGILAPAGPFCQGASITFTNTSATGYTYKWDFGTGGGFINKPFGPQTFIYNNPGAYTISVIALINGGGASCKDTAKVVINISPRPTANFSVSPTIGCNNLTGVKFTDLSINAISWNWNFGNSNTFNGQNPPLQNYNTIGNFVATLTVTGSNTCLHTYTTSINVYQKPIAAFTASSVCVGSSATFSDISTHAIGDPIVGWNWNFGDASSTATSTTQSPSHTYTAQNTYTVLLIAKTANCADTAAQTITINVKPIANYTLNPLNGCPTLSVNFTNTSTNATSYNWNFGNGNSSLLTNPTENFNNQTSSNVNYTVTLTASTGLGCLDTKSTTVTVFNKPISTFTLNAPIGCSPVAATFTNTSAGAVAYNWSFGDNATSTSTTAILSHTYTNATLLIQTYTAQLVAISGNGCKDSTSLTVTLYPRPFFNFVMVPNVGCSPLSINFPPVLGAVTYQWNFGDGSPVDLSANPTHVFTNTTTVNKTYTVQLIASNAFTCKDTTYGYPVVYAKPKASFTIIPANGCSPLNTNFTNTSVGGVTTIWKFGDGNTSSTLNSNHTYTNTTNNTNQTFTTTLITTNSDGCKDSISKPILVYFKPKATFTIDSPKCASKTIVFTNNTLGATGYNWNFGDASPISLQQNTTHTYTNTTSNNITYTVQLIATTANGCMDTATALAKIYAKPIAQFAITPTISCSPLNTTMTNLSTLANSYIWKFGDGTTTISTNTTHTYTNASNTTNAIFTCTLVAINNNGCKDSITKTVNVLANPKADFTVDTPACSPKLLTFTNTSQGGLTNVWNIGGVTSTNTNYSQAFTNITTANLTQTVQLVVTAQNTCKDTIVKTIYIHPKPKFNIIASPDSGCAPLTINFPIISGVTNYRWNFGDGNISVDSNPTNVYYNNSPTTKTFTVQLIATNSYGCADTSKKVIKVFAKPIALFQANPNTVFVPTTPVNCNNLSSGAVAYVWNFGDNGNSTEFSPSHTYQQPGEYQIYLIAINSRGCRDTFNLPTKIIAVLESDVDVPNAFSPNANGGNGGTFSVNDLNNDVFHPVLKGVDKYELNIFSRWGELLFVSKDVNKGWDGYYKGKLCTQDVYVWKIIATTIDGKHINKTGDLLLLR